MRVAQPPEELAHAVELEIGDAELGARNPLVIDASEQALDDLLVSGERSPRIEGEIGHQHTWSRITVSLKTHHSSTATRAAPIFAPSSSQLADAQVAEFDSERRTAVHLHRDDAAPRDGRVFFAIIDGRHAVDA